MMAWLQAFIDLPLFLEILLKITAILAAAWLLHFVLQRANPQWRVLLWRSIMAGVIVVPIMASVSFFPVEIAPPFQAETAPISHVSMDAQTLEPTIDVLPTPLPSIPQATADAPTRSLGTLEWLRQNSTTFVYLLWGLVCLAMTVRLAISYRRLLRTVRLSTAAPERLERLLHHVAHELKCRQRVAVRVSFTTRSPCLIGLFKPTIIIPETLIEDSQIGELPAVFAHELSHVRSGDLPWMHLSQWLQVILWPHPLVWWLKSAHQEACEKLCDAVAAEFIGSVESYSGTLSRIALELVEKASAFECLPMVRSAKVVERLRFLQRKEHAAAPSVAWACTLALVGLIACAGFGGLRLVYAEAAETGLELNVAISLGTSQEDQLSPAEIVLEPDAEDFLQSMTLTSPDVIRQVRSLLQEPDKITSAMASRTVESLMLDSGPEGMRAAADLLACETFIVRLFIMRRLYRAGQLSEYFLTNIVAWWDHLWEKEKATLERTLPRVLNSNKDNDTIEGLVDQITVLMILNSGKIVPLAGIRLAEDLNLERDEILAALEAQMDNEIYDHFANEHPVRKAAFELLGEEYVSPAKTKVDYSAKRVAREMGLEPSAGLTVGILTSLYTATGPCLGGRDGYGWYKQSYLFDVFAKSAIDTRIYFHPITELEDSTLPNIVRDAALDDTILNAASSHDLSICNVTILSGVYNLQTEVVDALEDFVWHGGGIITLDGAGIISCLSSKKFSALQDMHDLNWNWQLVADQTLVEIMETPLTEDINLSLPVDSPTKSFSKNGYTFGRSEYAGQILLRFNPDNKVALRVSTYGHGRIAHFGWLPKFGMDETGKRNWELFYRVVRWAAGHDDKDLRPKPAFSKRRYQEAAADKENRT